MILLVLGLPHLRRVHWALCYTLLSSLQLALIGILARDFCRKSSSSRGFWDCLETECPVTIPLMFFPYENQSAWSHKQSRWWGFIIKASTLKFICASYGEGRCFAIKSYNDVSVRILSAFLFHEDDILYIRTIISALLTYRPSAAHPQCLSGDPRCICNKYSYWLFNCISIHSFIFILHFIVLQFEFYGF